MAAGARRINMAILFTNLKLLLIHFESVPRRRSKASTIAYKKKKTRRGDGLVSLHWLIRKIPSYQTLQYLGIGLKHERTKKD